MSSDESDTQYSDAEHEGEEAREPQPVVRVHKLSRVGAPPKYRVAMCEIAANMAAQGATDFEIAQALDVATGTIYRWQHEHPEFREALKLGKNASDDRVERTLYHRAVGYSHMAVKVMQDKGLPVVVEYVEHVAPDVGAMTLWLTNRRKDEWKVKQSQEITGKDGGPVQYEDARDRNLRALEQVSARLAGAAPGETAGTGALPADSGDAAE